MRKGKVLQFRTNEAKMNRLDEIQKNLGDGIVQQLKEKLGQNVAVGYTNLGYKDGRGFEFYIYDNKYDFKTVTLKFIEIEETEAYTRVDIYIEVIEKALEEGGYTTYAATEMEKDITEIIEKHNPKDINIFNGYLYSGELYCCELALEYIDRYKHDKEKSTLHLYEDDLNESCEYIIDLQTGHILELINGKEVK